ncbi:MAG TPA: exosortase-associated EpsI family protein, partial [Bryobacteraceae bacterium]|nr:exosortase-associated EpsI family protein [Bryobacteraceae bacterium]
PIPVNQYTMEKGQERILVLYWYQNSRDTWSDEFHVKLRLLPDLIRYRRSDISLVRLIVPIGSSDSSRELADCTDFTRAIFPDLAQRLASLH